MNNDLVKYILSLLDQDDAPIVICNLEHTIIYMNQSAISKYGDLVNKSILDCHNAKSSEMIKKSVEYFLKNVNNNKVYESYNSKENKDVYIIALRDKDKKLIGYYEKHEYRNKETSKIFDI